MSKAQVALREHSRFSTSAGALEPPFDGESVYVPPVADEFRKASEGAGGLIGDAQAATAEKGQRIHEVMSDALADFIRQVVAPRQVTLKNIAIPD